jgi:cardiolipin synthase
MSNIKLFFSGDEYYLRLLEEIQNAKSSIWLESYIFEADEIGKHLLLALHHAKSRRPLDIRILVDGVGSSGSAAELKKLCSQYGLGLRIYHPLSFLKVEMGKALGFWSRALYLFRRINKRDHRKVVLIDRKTVFIGSCNISKVHSERLMGPRAWRDTICEILVTEKDKVSFDNLREAFQKSWSSSRIFSRTQWATFVRRRKMAVPARHQIYNRFRLNSTPFLRFYLLRDLTRRLNEAQSEVLITNAYFLPRKSVLRALIRAQKRGVTVKLLLPAKTDVWFVREAARSLYSRLLDQGVQIFEYNKTVLHAKTLVIDDWASVGSHNLNHRSFLHDLEVEVSVSESEIVAELRQQWKLDLLNAKPVLLEELRLTSWPRKFIAHIFYWLRFWL